MTYQINQQLELPVRDLRVDVNTGAQYAVVYDDEREYRIYNILNCQKESLPDKMYVKVSSVNVFGIKLRQDEGRLFQEHYQKGKLYVFYVKDVKLDHNSDTPYYIIEDDFASHHFYFKGEQNHEINENIILEVEGFTERGFLKLKEVKHITTSNIDDINEDGSETKEQELNDSWNSLPVLEIEDENETLELKASISFPPAGEGKADIDKQLFNILKELTAFMNTKGGTLYIGIHDKTKKVIGIEGDFSHLNDGDDEYAGSYKPDKDGYELKIRNTMDSLCPSVANSLTKIEFKKLEGHLYCQISVSPSRRPIFLAGTQLFVRQGNRVKRLSGDEITFFITERLTISIKEMVDTEDLQMNGTILDEETIIRVVRNLLNERRTTAIAPPPPSLEEVDYWIVWNDDYTWKRQRQKADGNVLQVPVYKGMSNPLVVFCYANNRINVVKLADFRKGTRLNELQKRGWSEANKKPKNIFVAEPSSLVVLHNVDYNHIEYVKLHALTDFNPTATADRQGAPVLPNGSRTVSYSIIGAEHRAKVRNLIYPKNLRATKNGTPITSPTFASEIQYLKDLFRE